jgi:hypothetical protein
LGLPQLVSAMRMATVETVRVQAAGTAIFYGPDLPDAVGTYKLSVCVGSLGLACRTAPFGRPRLGGWGTWVNTAVERDCGASARADDRRLKVCAEWSLAWWGVAKW